MSLLYVLNTQSCIRVDLSAAIRIFLEGRLGGDPSRHKGPWGEKRWEPPDYSASLSSSHA